MGKVAVNGKATPGPVIGPFDRLDSAEVAHFIRERLTALSNALHVVRVVAASDPRVPAAVDVADRQVNDLAALAAGLRDRGQGGGCGPRKRKK